MPTGALDLLVQYTILGGAAMDKDGRARCSVQLLVSKSTYGVVLLYVRMYVHISYRQSIAPAYSGIAEKSERSLEGSMQGAGRQGRQGRPGRQDGDLARS
jgi:hypothetical protein